MRRLAALVLGVLSWSPIAKAGSVTVEDFSITASYPAGVPLTGTISAMWGSYSGGVFTPFFSSTQSAINTGYLDTDGNELAVVLTQSDNTIITAGMNLFVSIFNVPGGAATSVWSDSAAQIILSDPLWIAPTFTLTTPTDLFGLTASTVALPFNGVTGTYNFNGGSPEVTLAQPTPTPPPPDGGSFTVRAPGGVRFITSSSTDISTTNTNPPLGVYLDPGETAWKTLSDRQAKTEPAAVDHRQVLGQVDAMPVSSWEYKHDPGRRYIGPMAQDFHAAFGLGHDDKHISTLDLDGVALSALKGLIAELQERKDRSAAQELRLRELRAELLGLQQRVAAE